MVKNCYLKEQSPFRAISDSHWPSTSNKWININITYTLRKIKYLIRLGD